MSSNINYNLANFYLPGHFPADRDFDDAHRLPHIPFLGAIPSDAAHVTTENVATIETSGAISSGEHSGSSYLKTFSNRAAIVPYQRAPPTLSTHREPLTASQIVSSLPSHQETEAWLRNHLKIPPPQPLNLWCLRDTTNLKKLPNQTEIIFLAIWGSQFKRLGLAEIYMAIEERYPGLKTSSDKTWQRSIRHRLSFKACFVRMPRDRRGADWMIDVSKGLQNARRSKASLRHSSTYSSSSDSQTQSDEDSLFNYTSLAGDSDSFVTPPPLDMTDEFTFMGSNLSISDLNIEYGYRAIDNGTTH